MLFVSLLQIIVLILVLFTLLYAALISYMVYRGCNYIPTPKREIDSALSVLQPGDVFIDLGFGYGEVLEAALKKGAAKVIGYELDPIRYLQVWWKLRTYGKAVELHFADIWSADLSKATVVFTFFTVIHMRKLYTKAKKEAKNARWFVSYIHEIPGVTPTKSTKTMRFFKL